MAELKTKPTGTDIADFLSTLDDEQRRDSEVLIEMMQRVTGDPAAMWGASIVGFGLRHLKYASGRELDWMKLGFSPRKGKLSIYCPDYLGKYEDKLNAIGKHKTGKGCLYVQKLSDVDTKKLESFLRELHQRAE